MKLDYWVVIHAVHMLLIFLLACRPACAQEAWTHLERERCCSMAFMQGKAMSPLTAKNLGLSVRPAAAVHTAAAGLPQQQQQQQLCGAQPGCASGGGSGSGGLLCTEDHLFIGTARGEVLVCDVARQGLVVLRVPVLK